MNFSKKRKIHTKIVDFLQAWYNFVKPHKSLRVTNRWKPEMEAKNTYDGRETNRLYLEIGATVDVQNTCSVISVHDPFSIVALSNSPTERIFREASSSYAITCFHYIPTNRHGLKRGYGPSHICIVCVLSVCLDLVLLILIPEDIHGSYFEEYLACILFLYSA